MSGGGWMEPKSKLPEREKVDEWWVRKKRESERVRVQPCQPSPKPSRAVCLFLWAFSLRPSVPNSSVHESTLFRDGKSAGVWGHTESVAATYLLGWGGRSLHGPFFLFFFLCWSLVKVWLGKWWWWWWGKSLFVDKPKLFYSVQTKYQVRDHDSMLPVTYILATRRKLYQPQTTPYHHE